MSTNELIDNIKNGDNVKANESWKFSEKLSSPTTIYLDLSFDRLPKKEK